MQKPSVQDTIFSWKMSLRLSLGTPKTRSSKDTNPSGDAGASWVG